MISNHVFQNSGNEDDAKDVLQDTLVALWQNVRKPHFELTVQLSTYLLAIAKNTWLKQLGNDFYYLPLIAGSTANLKPVADRVILEKLKQ
ncbi:MAG: sigma factor [Bacteroidetes bacterium]|nr:sigma factor [Bacteroidota bacterium]MDA1224412.1 sigma factor [Bacteroidota bacterium]